MQEAITIASGIIKQFEGFRASLYLCPSNFATIGYGHVLKPNEKYKDVTKDEADALLHYDILTALSAISRNIKVPLGTNQLAALISFTFNVGAGGLERSTLRLKINREEHAEVPHQLMRWVWGAGRILPGLIARRKAESLLYMCD